jgi:hypothetical protein
MFARLKADLSAVNGALSLFLKVPPPPQRDSPASQPGPPRPGLGSGGHLTDPTAAANLHLAVDADRLRPKSSA